jgi:uncharacterized protein (DUF2164 family)
MSVKRRLDLTEEQKAPAVAAIRKHFREERGEEIGELAAGMLLDVVLDNVSPQIYNWGSTIHIVS